MIFYFSKDNDILYSLLHFMSGWLINFFNTNQHPNTNPSISCTLCIKSFVFVEHFSFYIWNTFYCFHTLNSERRECIKLYPHNIIYHKATESHLFLIILIEKVYLNMSLDLLNCCCCLYIRWSNIHL